MRPADVERLLCAASTVAQIETALRDCEVRALTFPEMMREQATPAAHKLLERIAREHPRVVAAAEAVNMTTNNAFVGALMRVLTAELKA